MPKKYDTNPLDPDFPKRIQEAQRQEVVPDSNAETIPFAPPLKTQDQTRRYDHLNNMLNEYSAHEFMQTNLATMHSANVARSSNRKVEKIGLPENILTALPYIPWYFGMVAAILLLLLVPKSEGKVRFHAAQGLAAHLGIFIVTAILGAVGNVADLANVGNVIFQIVTTIFMIIWAVRAWKGEPVLIESVEELTNWLEEKIRIQK